MFDQLFFRSDALTRQLSAPVVDERRQYLAQCAAQGIQAHPAHESSPFAVNRRVPEIS